MLMKNSNDTIGNRTRDLLACSAVPRVGVSVFHNIIVNLIQLCAFVGLNYNK